MSSLPELYRALDQRTPFTLVEGHVKRDNWFTSVRKWSKSYRTQEAEKIALAIIKDLKNQEKLSPHESKHNPALKAARIFRKTVIPNCLPSSIFKNLLEEEVAFSVGLSTDICRKNPGFISFAKDSGMASYLCRHRLRLTTSQSHEIILPLSPKAAKKYDLPEGSREAKWTDLTKSLKPKIEKAKEEPFSHYFFREGGLTFKSFFREPKPGKELKLRLYRDKGYAHKWGNRYLLEVCVHSEGAGITGNHSWWRYKTPDGKVYSDAKYREKGGFKDSRIQAARIQNPDSSEYTPGYHHKKITVEITKEQFEKLYQYDTDVINGRIPNYTFHNLNQNCTDEALKRLSMIGYKVPDFTVTFWRVYGNSTLVKLSSKGYEGLQHIHQRIADFVFKIFVVIGNLIQAWYKGFEPNPKVCGENQYFKSVHDLFDETKLHHTSPYYLIEGPYKELIEWREKLKKSTEECALKGISQEQVDYMLPDSWKIPTA